MNLTDISRIIEPIHDPPARVDTPRHGMIIASWLMVMHYTSFMLYSGQSRQIMILFTLIVFSLVMRLIGPELFVWFTNNTHILLVSQEYDMILQMHDLRRINPVPHINDALLNIGPQHA